MISYRAEFGLWWPDYDRSPEACHGRVRKNLRLLDLLVRHCPSRRMVVQAGGHAGMFARRLVTLGFQQVHAFEPEPALAECCRRNCQHLSPRVTVHSVALGSGCGALRMRSHGSAGSWRVDENGDYATEAVTLDSLDLEDVDALVLDVEAHEPHVLRGARETVGRWRPVIAVELLPRAKAKIEKTMRKLRYECVGELGADAVYCPS